MFICIDSCVLILGPGVTEDAEIRDETRMK